MNDIAMEHDYGSTLRLAEETLLLLLDESTGYLIPMAEWKLACVLSGAVLMDLALENRIDTDPEKLFLIDASHTGDELLDPFLGDIVFETDVHSVQYWVERLAPRAQRIYEQAFERLVRKGILNFESGGFWTLTAQVVASGRYPSPEGDVRVEIKRRLTQLLLDEEAIPDPRDVMIIALVHGCGGLARLFEGEERERVQERAEFIRRMDFVGQAISKAVDSIYHPPPGLRVATSRPLPVLKLMGTIRSRSFWSGNYPLFFAEQRERLGPVFRFKIPGRDVVVLAGAEMNRWVNLRGRYYLRARDYLNQYVPLWGANRAIASMDGADHFRLRRAMRDGTARRVVMDRVADVFSLGRQTIGDWGIGNVVPGERAAQRLIGVQMSQLACSVDGHDIVDDLHSYQSRALLTHAQSNLPKFMIRTPRMRRLRRKVLEFFAHIHTTHTTGQREGKRRDLIDDIMELHHSDPQFMPETDLGFGFVAPLIAGHYTGSAMSFALYELLNNPDLCERITQEADALFAGGDPGGADLTMDAIDVSHRFIMETLRLHPVVPAQLRRAMNAIELNGMEIPTGTDIFLVHTAAHFNEKYFKNAQTFDIDRYLPERAEHRTKGAFVPFGLGTHTCLGQRFTELQLVANLLLAAHHLELKLVPEDYQLKLSPLPKLSPDKRFKFKVVRHRHPLN